ncbi:MAG TPA: HEAT repeat domain-containing protein [Nitrospirota bacterium]|jgi:HEAT repeat protein
MTRIFMAAAALVIFTATAQAAPQININDQAGNTVLAKPGTKDIPALIDMVRGTDSFVRAQAQYVLTGMAKEALPAVHAALRERRCVPELIYILNGVKDESSAGVLAELLDIKDSDTLDTVKQALYAMGKEAVPYLFDALLDGSRRTPAAQVLATLKEPSWAEAIYPYLKDEDPAIRAAAAMVERSWLDLNAEGHMAALLTDTDAGTRRDAAEYFASLAQKTETPGKEKLLSDPDEQVRMSALKITTLNRDLRFADKFASMLKDDPSPGVRRLAAEALFRCVPAKAAPPLIGALKDPDETVALDAAARLGEMKAKEAKLPLIAMLTAKGKPSDEVVDGVSSALAEIGEPFDGKIFLPYVNWDNLYVVRGVFRAWEAVAVPEDIAIRDALLHYLTLSVDDRYKWRAQKLMDKLGWTGPKG